MKRTLIMAVLLVCTFFIASEKTFAAAPQIYAVIIGVSKYSDASITFLKYAHRDAEAYRNFLESPKGGSVPSENIVLLTNERATRSAVIKGLREMFNKATEDDVVVFFFSGHGVPDPKVTTDLYFSTYDTDDENYTGTALLKEDVARQFSNSKAKLKLFFADACHSGGSGIYLGTKDDGAALVNTLVTKISNISEPSWAAIAAASSSEKSYEDTKWGNGHGVFTYKLIQGLEGDADKTNKQNSNSKGNGDGIVTVRELFDYLSNVIPAETGDKQHPDKQSKNEDVFPVSAVSADKFTAAVTKYKKQAVVANTEGTKNGKENNGLIGKDEVRKFDTETKEMKSNICYDGNYAYGSYCFVNNYGEDIVLTSHWGGYVSDQNVKMIIAAGEKICLERIRASSVNNSIISTPAQNTTFYFKTIAEGKPIKYGTRKLILEACMTKTEVLTRQNLYLSLDGEKW